MNITHAVWVDVKSDAADAREFQFHYRQTVWENDRRRSYVYIYIGGSVEAEEGADDDDGEVGRDIG